MMKTELPLQKRLRAIKDAQERIAIAQAFYIVVMDLEKTDKLIERLPDGILKTEKIAIQEQAWAIVLSEEMCGRIMIKE